MDAREQGQCNEGVSYTNGKSDTPRESGPQSRGRAGRRERGSIVSVMADYIS